MRLLSIDLETTIFNFPFVDDAPQYKADTLKLFEEIKAGKFRPFTSSYVLDEIEKDPDIETRNKMKAFVPKYGIKVLSSRDETDWLAERYIEAGIIPARFGADALHIACATVAELDIIVSLNFRHIVKHKTIAAVDAINKANGYKGIFIHTPAEVIENG